MKATILTRKKCKHKRRTDKKWREVSKFRWQEEWDKADKGRWTYRLIPHLDKWINRRHGSVNYYLTQMLSGHGYFRAYLYKFKYEDSLDCPNCSGLEENAEHVIFAYSTFSAHRCELEATLEQRINPETLVEVMLSSNEAWEAVTTFATKVIQDLRCEEQRRNKLMKTWQKKTHTDTTHTATHTHTHTDTETRTKIF